MLLTLVDSRRLAVAVSPARAGELVGFPEVDLLRADHRVLPDAVQAGPRGRRALRRHPVGEPVRGAGGARRRAPGDRGRCEQ